MGPLPGVVGPSLPAAPCCLVEFTGVYLEWTRMPRRAVARAAELGVAGTAGSRRRLVQDAKRFGAGL